MKGADLDFRNLGVLKKWWVSMRGIEKKVFSAGPAVIQDSGNGYFLFKLVNDSLTSISERLPIDGAVVDVTESSDPETGVPGIVIISSDFYYFLDFDSFTCKKIEMPPGYSKSVLFDGFVRVYVDNSELMCQKFGSDSPKVLEEVPIDSFFICSTPHRALLASREASLAMIVSSKGTSEFPSGYASAMACAAFFDENSVVFATFDRDVVLVRGQRTVESVRVDSIVSSIAVVDLDCYERSVVCLDQQNKLHIIQFNSKSDEIVAVNVLDFAILRDPFDVVVMMHASGNLEAFHGRRAEDTGATMRDVVDALDARIVSGLAEIAEARRRATLRRRLAAGDKAELPHMVTIFGDKPQPNVESEDKERNEPNLWIENVRGLEFEIHCDVDLPPVCDVVLTSGCCAFTAACISSPMSDTALKVTVEFEVEKMSKYDGFGVFIRNSGSMYYAGKVEFAVRDVMNGNGIMRLREDFFVSFPPHFVPQDLPEGLCETLDSGVILHVKGSTFEKFEMELVSLAAQLPEDSVYQRKSKTHMQIQIAKEATRYVRSFPQAISQIAHDGDVPKHVLVNMKTSITDLLASIIW